MARGTKVFVFGERTLSEKQIIKGDLEMAHFIIKKFFLLIEL